MILMNYMDEAAMLKVPESGDTISSRSLDFFSSFDEISKNPTFASFHEHEQHDGEEEVVEVDDLELEQTFQEREAIKQLMEGKSIRWLRKLLKVKRMDLPS